MDNEKLNNEETVEEVVEETAAEETVETEEVVEEVATEEVVEEAVEEVATEEDTEEVAEDAEVAEEEAETAEEPEVTIIQIWQCPECETICDEEVCGVCGAQCELIEIEATVGDITEAPRKNITAIIIGAVAAVIVLLAVLFGFGVINPYEIGYVDVSGVTLKELADQSGYSVKEYKKVNGLSWLMPVSTNENAVKNNITVKATIAQSGMAFEEFKEYYGWGNNVTENSTVGKALGETKLAIILGVKDVEKEIAEQTLTSFKEFYGFGDEVTLDTLYKDVRVAIDKKTRESRLEQEKEAKKAEKEADEKSDEEDATVETKDAEEPEDAEAEDAEETEAE